MFSRRLFDLGGGTGLRKTWPVVLFVNCIGCCFCAESKLGSGELFIWFMLSIEVGGGKGRALSIGLQLRFRLLNVLLLAFCELWF